MSISPLGGSNDVGGSGVGELRERSGRTGGDRAEVARQFEALLLTQLLRDMRDAGSGEGWLGTEGDSSLSALSEMGEQLVAQSWSHAGGLGLAGLLEKAFQRTEADPTPPATHPGSGNA